MEEKNNSISGKIQEEQEWENIDNRQYFESANNKRIDTGQQKGFKEAEDTLWIDKEKVKPQRRFAENQEFYGSAVAVLSRSVKISLAISWISAALTAFTSPYFAIVGIIFGVYSNRMAKGSGNAAIITNVVLALVNLIWGLFFVMSLRRIFVWFQL